MNTLFLCTTATILIWLLAYLIWLARGLPWRRPSRRLTWPLTMLAISTGILIANAAARQYWQTCAFITVGLILAVAISYQFDRLTR